MNYFTTPTIKETAFTVSSLNRQIQQLLEASLPWILVEGEISNLARPNSGHWYFSLKDDKSQIRCTMFKNKNNLVRFKPKEGDMVRLRAKVTFYGPRGDCQLSVESMESAGEGALQMAFERLKASLKSEGLFNSSTKKALPKMPERVALITSSTGAVIRDIVTTFKRRFPLTELTLFPSTVQGNGSVENLIKQLHRADSNNYFDAIIIGRGGGSLEDLWSFNDEALARAIFSANTPIISAVGHETDFTICDFVADTRAPTPTAAAELLSPDQNTLIERCLHQSDALEHRIEQQIQQHQQRLDFLIKAIRHPKERLEQQDQQLNQLTQRLIQSIRLTLEKQNTNVNHLSQRLEYTSPQKTLSQNKAQLDQYQNRLGKALQQNLTNQQQRFINIMEKLNLVSPLNILSRGYAIPTKDKHVIRSINDVTKGDAIHVRIEDGIMECEVK
ncbi:exodeoxyribonuclease VII large subunit [Marinomonas sp. 2405UD68-3]|uniref:exodeoxyribonuclease VII large subunit n=1 Tax=Marinomonas sp. 2405UD68-3 TaxID=3391835 RepID=UPI0039C8F937